ncbi:unnamed protein product [Mucor hiemalis]
MSIARIAFRSVAFKPARVAAPMAARSFTAAAVMQKDLFIKELKAYKPQPVSATEEFAAKDLKLPAAPAVPQVDADLAEQLAKYDAEPEEVAH